MSILEGKFPPYYLWGQWLAFSNSQLNLKFLKENYPFYLFVIDIDKIPHRNIIICEG